MRCPSYGGCKTLTAATVGVFFFAERISNTGLTGIALERPQLGPAATGETLTLLWSYIYRRREIFIELPGVSARK